MNDVMPAGQIGRSLPRAEARLKVTGRAEYIHNLRLPGMLWAKIARSTVPHGRIKSIDTRAAAAMAGVHSVVTGEDILKVIPEPYYGPAFHDQPILALGKVRFAGEPVAVVLADDPKIAEAASHEISIDYEELPAVYDEVEALTSTAYVHEVLKPAGMFADLKHLAGKRDTNIALDYHLRRGDVDKALPRPTTSSNTHSVRRSRCIRPWSPIARSPMRPLPGSRCIPRPRPRPRCGSRSPA